jgi:CubicO group peptidase (beta-lactamase class C family)
LGSVTKQFTAMAILLLQEQGKLSTDDLVSKHINAAPEAWKDVTIHHLLTHTSGIPSFTSLPSYMPSMPLPSTPIQTLDRVRELPLEFTPGEKFTYSNSGYVLLGQIIETVSGMSYEAYVDEMIFRPLDMTSTGYDHHAKVLPRRATGYRRSGGELQTALYLDMTIPHAAGALYSTVEDLHRWSVALDDGKLISAEAQTKMFTPVLENYGYGWAIDEHFGRPRASHGGGINGFATFVARYPEEKVFVAVLCNIEQSDPGRVANDLAAIALGEKYDIPQKRTFIQVNPEILETYVGQYEVPPEMVLTLERDGNRLLGRMGEQPRLELHAESETEFFVEEVAAAITIVKDDQGKVTHLMLRQGGRELEAKKIK